MRDGKPVQMPHSCYHVETIRHPNSSYVTTKLYETSTCGCNNNTIFSKRLFVSYRRCMPRTLAWRRAGLDHACESGNMATLLTSLLFVFEILFLHKYRVNYYDYLLINLRSPRDCRVRAWGRGRSRLYVLDRKLLERLMSPSPKSQVMFASAFS